MGREIRKIKKGWEHPTENGNYHPLYDLDYEKAFNEWIKNHILWEKGNHPDQNKSYAKDCRYFAELEGNPPDIDYYRKEKWDEEKDEMWYVLYENVSEGTPLSPAFKTKKELSNYLVSNGDFWGGNWTKEQADRFMEQGWCMSGMIRGGKFYSNQEQMSEDNDNR